MQHLPLLAYVLGSGAVDTSAIRQGDSAAFSTACKGALAACIKLAALEGRRPLLVVEDVQWLGELGHMLSHLLNEVALDTPLVVITTARVAADDAMLAELVGGNLASARSIEDGTEDSCNITGGHKALAYYDRLRIIEVAALTTAQGSALLGELLPGAQLPAELEAELHEKSLGLPYYYEEAARMLLRRGVVVPGEEGSYKFVGGLDSIPIPDDLRTLILGRLDTLPPELRELAQHASVLGRSYALEDLLAIEARLRAAS
jgi:predicted ATPase